MGSSLPNFGGVKHPTGSEQDKVMKSRFELRGGKVGNRSIEATMKLCKDI
jgi:hypothetical protein